MMMVAPPNGDSSVRVMVNVVTVAVMVIVHVVVKVMMMVHKVAEAMVLNVNFHAIYDGGYFQPITLFLPSASNVNSCEQ